MLVNSGAEAVENGVKIARKATGRRGVAVLEHAYHGRTSLTMAMNYKAMPYGAGFGPFPGDVLPRAELLPVPRRPHRRARPRRAPSTTSRSTSARRTSRSSSSSRSRARAASRRPADGFLPALQRWANANGVVIAADEIQSGMGRTGAWFASEHFGFEPDLVFFAKGIAGGLPLAGVTGRAEIMDAAQPGGLGGTFGGNPVAAAAAIAVIEQIEQDDLLAAGRRIEARLRPALEALQQEFDIIGDVRGKGAMLAIELVEPGTARHDQGAEPGRGEADRRLRRAAGRPHPHRRHVGQRDPLPPEPRHHRRAARRRGRRCCGTRWSPCPDRRHVRVAGRATRTGGPSAGTRTASSGPVGGSSAVTPSSVRTSP